MGIAGHEKIYKPVAVVVAPSRSGHETAAVDARLVGDVFKFTVAQIAIEGVAAEAGDEEIKLAVIIVIGDGYAHAPTAAGEARFLGDVPESAVRPPVVESDEWVAAGAETLDGGAVGEDDVEEARGIEI